MTVGGIVHAVLGLVERVEGSPGHRADIRHSGIDNERMCAAAERGEPGALGVIDEV